MKVPVVVASITAGRADPLGELVPEEETDRILDLMGRIVTEQRWALGLAIAATADDSDAAKLLASKHVPQHPNTPQLRAPRDR